MSHETSHHNRYTRGIAQFVSSLTYDAIPAEVKARIKLLMLDSLGCALYGADLEWSTMQLNTLTRVDTARSSECKFASEADIVDKFEKLAVKALPKSQVE